MAHLASLDFSSLTSLRDKLAGLPDPHLIINDCANELAQRLLQLAADRTPVGQYPGSSGKVGGTLKNGWQIGDVRRSGNVVSVEVFNPVHYSHFVEFGHRNANGSGWVDGKFMLTISADELQALSSQIISDKINDYLRQIVP